MSPRSIARLLFLSICTAGLLSGCAVTEEKKVKFVYIQEQKPLELTRVSIDGVLKDEDGKPLNGVSVRVVTFHDNDAATTAREGKFRVFTRYEAGETVNFQFKGQGLDFVESVQNIPQGIDPIKLYFTVLPNRTVHFIAYEY